MVPSPTATSRGAAGAPSPAADLVAEVEQAAPDNRLDVAVLQVETRTL